MIIEAGKSLISEPMPQFESEGWQAAVEPGKADVPDQRLSGRRILSHSGEV